MKRILGILILATALRMSDLLPFEALEIAELVPIETLAVSVEQNQVVLDGGDCSGRGENWQAALEDLRHGAEGTLFLGTAEQVIFTKEAASLLPQVIRSEALRPGASVCICAGQPPRIEEAKAFLSAHPTGVTLQQIQAAVLQGKGIALPMLVKTQGGLRLYANADG